MKPIVHTEHQDFTLINAAQNLAGYVAIMSTNPENKFVHECFKSSRGRNNLYDKLGCLDVLNAYVDGLWAFTDNEWDFIASIEYTEIFVRSLFLNRNKHQVVFTLPEDWKKRLTNAIEYYVDKVRLSYARKLVTDVRKVVKNIEECYEKQ